MPFSNLKVNEVWNKLFPFRVGEKVRYTKSPDASTISPEIDGTIGTIVSVGVEMQWKIDMVLKWKCYPPSILKEKMYKVVFPQKKGSSFALRESELERIVRD